MNGLPQIAPVKIVVGRLELESLVPDDGLHPELRLPVKLDEVRLAFGVHHPKGVNAKSFHHAIAARNRAIRHRPHQHVGGFGHEGRPVPERVVGAAGLRKGAIGFHFDGMDEIGKLDGVLDEENRDVVADEVPIALFGIELHGKPAHVTRCIDRARAAGDRREPGEDRHLLALALEQISARQVGERLIGLKEPMRRGASGVNDPLRNPLVIEVKYFLPKDEILEQRRAASAGLERLLIVGNGDALVGGELPSRRIRALPATRWWVSPPRPAIVSNLPLFRHGALPLGPRLKPELMTARALWRTLHPST